MASLSVIIPVGINEQNHQQLLDQLEIQKELIHEVVVAGVNGNLDGDSIMQHPLAKEGKLKVSLADQGRAKQMNTASRCASGDYLCFLHADSHLSMENLPALLGAIEHRPGSFYFFKLDFLAEETSLLKLNALGANLRSRLFGAPFGDQGFCLSGKLFHQLEGFDELADYGEDHLLTWKLKALSVPFYFIQTPLKTSGRKYTKNGWLKTMLKHQYLWLKQVLEVWQKKQSKQR